MNSVSEQSFTITIVYVHRGCDQRSFIVAAINNNNKARSGDSVFSFSNINKYVNDYVYVPCPISLMQREQSFCERTPVMVIRVLSTSTTSVSVTRTSAARVQVKTPLVAPRNRSSLSERDNKQPFFTYHYIVVGSGRGPSLIHRRDGTSTSPIWIPFTGFSNGTIDQIKLFLHRLCGEYVDLDHVGCFLSERIDSQHEVTNSWLKDRSLA